MQPDTHQDGLDAEPIARQDRSAMTTPKHHRDVAVAYNRAARPVPKLVDPSLRARGAETMLAEAFAVRTLFVYRHRKNAPRLADLDAEGTPPRNA